MKTKPPLILVAPGTEASGPEFLDHSISLSDAYLEAVRCGGGMPLVMPCTTSPDLTAQYVQLCDGVLMTGGEDVQPTLYGDELAPEVKATLSAHDPVRDLAEMCLIQEVFRQRKPLLAICRGMQILNVAFGGTLYADLRSECPGALEHSRLDRKDEGVHSVSLESDSLLAALFEGSELEVNSTHHQALREVAAPFRVTARSPDGVVEAVELGLAERHLLPYLLAVQFHPERLIRRQPGFVAVFQSFATACALGRIESI